MVLRAMSPFSAYLPVTPTFRGRGEWGYGDFATLPVVVETLREEAEIKRIGTGLFSGTVARRNKLWRELQNYWRQAFSNLEAARAVENRSSALLYYYAFMNLAKGELLETQEVRILDKRIGHGLSYSPTKGKTIGGDVLTVVDGIFPLLYERRTGRTIPIGTKLPVKRLLSHVPEIGSQLSASGVGQAVSRPIFTSVGLDSSTGRAVFAMVGREAAKYRTTWALIQRHFEEVAPPANWREMFAISTRAMIPLAVFESRVSHPYPSSGDGYETARIATQDFNNLNAILSSDYMWAVDAWLTPSAYQSSDFLLPPDIARYAVFFYASSLVRYKPNMFDPSAHPELAYLFDGIAREMALPALVDLLDSVRGRSHSFRHNSALRR